jgi:N-methylhydantoinase B
MTNTRNTPIEVMESTYPLCVREYAVRTGSAGSGQHAGGEGLCREIEFFAAATVTLLSERRLLAPWGLQGGTAAKPGANWLNGQALAGKVCCEVSSGDILRIETAGGGGWGKGKD